MVAYAKGSKPKDAEYAKGGAVCGKESNFMKVPDEFRNPNEGDNDAGANEDNKYGKDGAGAGTGFIKPPKAPKDKCIK